MSRTYRKVHHSQASNKDIRELKFNGVFKDIIVGYTCRDGSWLSRSHCHRCDYCNSVVKKSLLEKQSRKAVRDALKYDPDESYLE